MSKQTINVGATANDKQGDSLRAAFQKVNANFTELYTALGLAEDANLNLGAFSFTDSVSGVATITTTDSSGIAIDRPVTVNGEIKVFGDITPELNDINLGSPSKPFKSLYVSNNTIFIGGTALAVNQSGQLTINGSTVSGGGSSTAWNDVTGKPTFAAVATSGSYSDLSNKPSIPADIGDLTDTGNLLFDGDYGSLSNTPAIPTAVSQLTNDSGFLTTAVLANGLDADIKGSVFGDDSSVIVNAIDNSLHASNIYINGPGYIKGSADQTLNIQTSYDTTVPGQTITADDTQGGVTNNIINVWIQGGGTNYPEIVAVQAGWTVTGFGLTNDVITEVIYNDIAPGIVIYSIRTTTASQKGIDVTYTFTAPSTTVNTTKNWAFSDRGDLTIPGDIKSQGNINIDINLSDSTLRRWQLGEDGVLNIPGNISHRGSPGLTIGSSHNVYIVGDQGDNNRTWTFDGTSGDTILPNGTVIADDGNDGIEVIMPTTVGQANTFKWRFTDQAVGTSTMSLQAGTLDTNLDDWYFGFNSTKYIGIHGTGQYISWFNGADFGGRLIFGETSGNNAGDVNAIELKATDGDVYVTSTESVKITVDANDSSARVWTFDPSGNLNVPGGIVAEYEEDFTISTSYFGAGSPPGPTTKTFTFAANGTLTVPGNITSNSANGTVLSSDTIVSLQLSTPGYIWIGRTGSGGDIDIGQDGGGYRTVLANDRLQILANAPGSSKGSSGDYQGMVAFDTNYIYYCINAYDGTTDIWKRVALTGGTW